MSVTRQRIRAAGRSLLHSRTRREHPGMPRRERRKLERAIERAQWATRDRTKIKELKAREP